MMKKILTTICCLMTMISTSMAQSADTVASSAPVDTLAEVSAPDAGVIYIQPLFEYPVAPDDLPDITSRANWLMSNFWTPFDFKQNAVDQQALDHAFQVYITPLRWVQEDVADKSMKGLIDKLKKNPTLLIQFTKAAEHNLYGSSAQMWADGSYLMFVDALLAEKKISETRKTRYRQQRKELAASLVGTKLKPFSFVTPSGETKKIEFTTPFTLIEFGDPFCSDCAMYRINLETFPEIKQLVEDDKLNIYFIIPDGESVEDWERQLALYPSSWHRGAGKELDTVYDMRATPTVYLLDANGTIIQKYISSEAVREYLIQNTKE